MVQLARPNVKERGIGMFDVRQVRSGEHSVPNAFNADLRDFEELVHTYRPSIFRYALSSLRDRDLAATVTQDCFLRAFQGTCILSRRM
jgi:hypothetical protein